MAVAPNPFAVMVARLAQGIRMRPEPIGHDSSLWLCKIAEGGGSFTSLHAAGTGFSTPEEAILATEERLTEMLASRVVADDAEVVSYLMTDRLQRRDGKWAALADDGEWSEVEGFPQAAIRESKRAHLSRAEARGRR